MDNHLRICEDLSIRENEYKKLRETVEAVAIFVNVMKDECIHGFISELANSFKTNLESAVSNYLYPPSPEPEAMPIVTAESVKEKKEKQKYVKKNIFNTPILKFQTEKEVRIEILNMVNICKEKGYEVVVEPAQRRGPQFQIINGYTVYIDEIDNGASWKRLLSYKKTFERLHAYLQTKGLR